MDVDPHEADAGAQSSGYTHKVQPSSVPRVAYFPDSFHEVNGVAHTSRHFQAFAERRSLPFLCVRAGTRIERYQSQRALHTLELPRGPLSFALDKGLLYDPGFARHLPEITRAVREFRPDVIHITGPSELGSVGALLSHHLRVPLAASWHTNVHEYLARRSMGLLGLLPENLRPAGHARIEQSTLWATTLFYRAARLLFAPNPELCRLLEQATHRPCLLMPRGVDAELFSPARRSRPKQDGRFVLGYVGRLSIEKNIQLLARIYRELAERGASRCEFLIVGQGEDLRSLQEQMPGATFTGVLRGEALASAYADMDCFLFPSHTDTFGNVVLEAIASGVPAIVTPDGGPAHLVRSGCAPRGETSPAVETGVIVDDAGFAAAILEMAGDPVRHAAMCDSARSYALGASWDSVFEGVYAGYARMLQEG